MHISEQARIGFWSALTSLPWRRAAEPASRMDGLKLVPPLLSIPERLPDIAQVPASAQRADAPARAEEVLPPALVSAHNDRSYRTPGDLWVTKLALRRVLVVGSCLAQNWLTHVKRDGLILDYILTNNFSALPDSPPAPIGEYDFQIVQIPLRSILHENTYAHLAFGDVAAYEDLLGRARLWVSQYLDVLLVWNDRHGLLSFVTNFLVPQQSPMGRLLPRHDIRNMVHFIERLNAHLYEEIARRSNVYLLDIDQIAATIGRRGMQDDGVWTLSHGAVLNDCEYGLDRARIVPSPCMSAHYPAIAEGQAAFYLMAWAELVAMMRTIRQIDSVKLVIFDLDDTLWRGVAAEAAEITGDMIEGWPVGLMEAACFLKKRGVLLAIVSRNDETRIRDLFDRVMGGRLLLDDFAALRINWRPKAENVQEILAEVSLTEKSVVFVDDNPVERAAIKACFPAIRTLGAHPYYLRRTLLWSSEAQSAVMTDESMRRTEMVQAQIVRDHDRSRMSREDFLASLRVRMAVTEIESVEHKRFARALELINKTNQFNTTGRRQNRQDCVDLFRRGATFLAFDLEDRFSQYGLVGVAIVERFHIIQFVMSCRVLGLGAEDAFIAYIAARAVAAGVDVMTGQYIPTEANALAKELFQRNGFHETGSGWQLDPAAAQPVSPHIEITKNQAVPGPQGDTAQSSS